MPDEQQQPLVETTGELVETDSQDLPGHLRAYAKARTLSNRAKARAGGPSSAAARRGPAGTGDTRRATSGRGTGNERRGYASRGYPRRAEGRARGRH